LQLFDAQGGRRPLELRDGAQQCSTLRDLLTVELLLTAQKELLQHTEHHLMKLTGSTACDALLTDSLAHDPWLVLAVLAQVTGNSLLVLVSQGAEAGAGAAAAPPQLPKKGRRRISTSSSGRQAGTAGRSVLHRVRIMSLSGSSPSGLRPSFGNICHLLPAHQIWQMQQQHLQHLQHQQHQQHQWTNRCQSLAST
jgi:hypothetical protein